MTAILFLTAGLPCLGGTHCRNGFAEMTGNVCEQ
jgi:hypothetical protein